VHNIGNICTENDKDIEGQPKNVEDGSVKRVGNVFGSKRGGGGHEDTNANLHEDESEKDFGQAGGRGERETKGGYSHGGAGDEIDECGQCLRSVGLGDEALGERLKRGEDDSSDSDGYHEGRKNASCGHTSGWIHGEQGRDPHEYESVHGTFAEGLNEAKLEDFGI